jgi:prevent-host-death family protein
VHEAKTNFSKLLRDVAKGEEVVVLRSGEPVARIVAARADAARSSYGMYRGQFVIADDFDADTDELSDLFGVPR